MLKKIIRPYFIHSLAFLALFISSLNVYASQPFTVRLNLVNPDAAIDNIVGEVEVEGGQAPYRYIWSIPSVSIYHASVNGLPEGEEVTVKVVDANNDTVKAVALLPAKSIEERFNKFMKPAVDALASVLFFNLWQDTVRVKNNVLKAPFALDPEKTDYTIQQWLVEDGEKVRHQQPILILNDGGQERLIYAVGSGTIEHLASEGDPVFFVNKRGNRSDKKIAKISYASPQPFYNENLSTKTQGIPLIVVWLVLGALFFTLRMKFINVRGIKHSIDLVRGKFDNPNDKTGEISHFQALVTALSATVGLGNIAGVAIAISMGGPGATFWMILAGLIGMSSKFVECTLGVKYRSTNEDGEVSGGPMYYLSRGLSRRGLGKMGKVLAVIFAILCVGGSFGGGNMFQANQAFNQLTEIPGWGGIAAYGALFGTILAVLVGVVIIGGIKSIANVTDKIVPAMVGVYIFSAIAIIIINAENIGWAFETIFVGAFNPDAIYGGFIGVLILGFQRAAFSNEAGVGSAAIAHSAAKTNEPVSEGMVALLEPFIDTVLVCTMTALVIIFTGYADDSEGLAGAALTSAAFSSSLGEWSMYVLSFAVVLFAFSTMISWSYYGLKAWTYLFGSSKKADLSYKVLFLLFVIVGSSVGLGAVIDFSDLMILGMAFPNVLGLLIMSSEVKNDLKDYLHRVKTGVIKKFN